MSDDVSAAPLLAEREIEQLPTRDVADALVPVIRDLVSRGFLMPAGDATDDSGRAR